MSNNLQNPIFHDEDKAREWLEARVWSNGRVCPHCGADAERTRKLEGKKHRPGLFQCNECREQFTVTVGTVFERSKIPLTKWLMAIYLMSASKKGISSLQLSRMLGISYQSTWFMTHRIREAMKNPSFASGPLGGANKVVEADETYVGGKETNKHKSKRTPGRQGGKGKMPVVALVERDGQTRSFHVANVTAETLRPILVKNASRASFLMTDDSSVYPKTGAEFANHGTVNHSREEYVSLGGFLHTNTVESHFALLKRGVFGTFHSISEAHLNRYLVEFDFRANTRKITDTERAALIAEGIKGKRLTYRRTGEAGHA